MSSYRIPCSSTCIIMLTKQICVKLYYVMCYYHTLRKLLVKFSLVIYFPCKIVLIYQECGDSACPSHNEITRQRGQINTIGVGLLRTRNSGKFYTVCVIILHGVFCVISPISPQCHARIMFIDHYSTK